MSIFVELETLPEVVEARQRYLRSLAHPVGGIAGETIRQRTGHALVRLGRWVEGHRADETTILPTLRAASPRLAGSAK
jgi:hypothetical protein